MLKNSDLFSRAEHKYPYDWRTKKPTIFRATEQWFASVEGFRKAAMDAISQVTWIPSQVCALYRLIICDTSSQLGIGPFDAFLFVVTIDHLKQVFYNMLISLMPYSVLVAQSC